MAAVNLTAKAVNATANAAGGSSSPIPASAPAATARAKLVVTATGQAGAATDAHGGGGSAPGAAVAKTKASGTSGSFSAEADSGFKGAADGLLVTAVQANASGSTDGKDKAEAKAAINTTPAAFTSLGTALAFVTAGMPDSADADAVLAGNANISTAFGASPSFFAMGELGGQYSTNGTVAQTIAASIDFDVDITKLSTKGDLIVGFFNPVSVGASFTSLVFTLQIAGGATLISKTFTTVAAANAFFADNAIDLGAIGSGSAHRQLELARPGGVHHPGHQRPGPGLLLPDDRRRPARLRPPCGYRPLRPDHVDGGRLAHQRPDRRAQRPSVHPADDHGQLPAPELERHAPIACFSGGRTCPSASVFRARGGGRIDKKAEGNVPPPAQTSLTPPTGAGALRRGGGRGW